MCGSLRVRACNNARLNLAARLPQRTCALSAAAYRTLPGIDFSRQLLARHMARAAVRPRRAQATGLSSPAHRLRPLDCWHASSAERCGAAEPDAQASPACCNCNAVAAKSSESFAVTGARCFVDACQACERSHADRSLRGSAPKARVIGSRAVTMLLRVAPPCRCVDCELLSTLIAAAPQPAVTDSCMSRRHSFVT